MKETSKKHSLYISSIISDFAEGKKRILVTSDLLNRGINIPSINVVVNYDFPKDAQTYLHRIGRGGRFGLLALAINFIKESDQENLVNYQLELKTDVAPLPSDVEKCIGLFS